MTKTVICAHKKYGSLPGKELLMTAAKINKTKPGTLTLHVFFSGQCGYVEQPTRSKICHLFIHTSNIHLRTQPRQTCPLPGNLSHNVELIC